MAVVGLVLLSLGAKPIDVTWWGKCATFGLYFCFPLLLAGASDIAVADGFRVAGWVCAVPSLVYSYLSAVQYIPLGGSPCGRHGSSARSTPRDCAVAGTA